MLSAVCVYLDQSEILLSGNRLKELQESMDMCTDCCDITEMLLKMALNTIQSINQLLVEISSISHLQTLLSNIL